MWLSDKMGKDSRSSWSLPLASGLSLGNGKGRGGFLPLFFLKLGARVCTRMTAGVEVYADGLHRIFEIEYT